MVEDRIHRILWEDFLLPGFEVRLADILKGEEFKSRESIEDNTDD